MSDVQVDDQISPRLAAMSDAVQAALAETTQSLADQLVALAASMLPPGPLATSIAAQVDESGATIGSDLPYAAALEYGFAGTEQVRESLRLQSVVYGRPMTPREVLVRPHARTVDIPARNYLSGALDAMSGDIADAYTDAVDVALDAEDGT